MRKGRVRRAFWLVLAASVAHPVLAQAPQVAVGAAVKDMVGGEVGTVTSVDGATVIVKTDRHEVQIPASSMAPYNGAFLVNLSREQLNAAAERVLSATRPSLPSQEVARANPVVEGVTTGAGGMGAEGPPR